MHRHVHGPSTTVWCQNHNGVNRDLVKRATRWGSQIKVRPIEVLLDEPAYKGGSFDPLEARPMINQRYCPFCNTAAKVGCSHLALVAEAREFVRRCVESCQGQKLWECFCTQRREQQRLAGAAPPEPEDFTWLETAFCERFLKHLRWFGGMDYEWRSGPKLEQGGFWVLLWSKEPRRLWWELRDDFERRITLSAFVPPPETSPWLLWLAPR